MIHRWLLIGLLIAIARCGLAQQPADDPLQRILITPEIVLGNVDEIGLSQEQAGRIRSHIESASQQMQRIGQRLADARQRLAGSLAAKQVDVSQALDQLDELLAIEKQNHRTQLSTLIKIQSELTSEQREKARELAHTPQQLRSGLPDKLAKLKQLAERMRRNGKGVGEFQSIMNEFRALMDQGKRQQAELLLDRAIEAADRDQKPAKSDEARMRRRRAPLKQRSPEEIRTAATSLRKVDVAWRRIEWKTCLIDALAASKEQKKPILLWIFIDRPIDDERC